MYYLFCLIGKIDLFNKEMVLENLVYLCSLACDTYIIVQFNKLFDGYCLVVGILPTLMQIRKIIRLLFIITLLNKVFINLTYFLFRFSS